MKTVRFSSPHRQKHFDFFHAMEIPHFSVCAPVDVGHLLPWLRERELPFMASVAWCVSEAANRIPPFRQRIRGDRVVEHEVVHPSFSVPTDVADVFSFCEVTFVRPFDAFVNDARRRMAQMRTDPVFEDDPERDDYLFLSSFPWAAFSSISHPISTSRPDAVPRIVWGKFVDGPPGRAPMPLSLQAHHGLVDGRHAGFFFQRFQQIVDDPDHYLGS